MKALLPALIISVLPFYLNAQNLENIQDQKPVQLTGGLNLSTNFYSTTRSRASRDAFLWTLSGSPTLNIYGVTLPFTFVLSKKNEDFRQPFNQFGLSPYYKWAKLHLGYRSLSFSDYSLNGHIFNGVGAELTPGNWRLAGMYGTLLKPIEPDPFAEYAVQPTYKRKGYSFKIGYGPSSNFLDLIFLKGWDDPNSIERPADSAMVNPQENVVLAVKTHQVIFKKLIFDLDVGLSGFTSNLYVEDVPEEDLPNSGLVSNLLTVNYSTQFLTAGKAALSYRLKGVSLRLQYERVEPEYQTMGAYYFNTDQENITIAPGFSLFKRKMRVNASVGWMRNNILDNKANQTNRRINSLQLSYAPSAKFNISGTYNNYQITQQLIDRVKRDVIDSLQLEQFTNNLNVNANYNFGSKTKRYVFSLGYSRQATDQEFANEAVGNNNTVSESPMASFRFNNRESDWGYRVNFNYNSFENASINSTRWGLTLGANKSLWDKKMTLNGNMAYFKTKLSGQDGGSTIRFNLRSNYKLSEKHALGVTSTLVKRSSQNERIEAFSEFLGSINYSYSF